MCMVFILMCIYVLFFEDVIYWEMFVGKFFNIVFDKILLIFSIIWMRNFLSELFVFYLIESCWK